MTNEIDICRFCRNCKAIKREKEYSRTGILGREVKYIRANKVPVCKKTYGDFNLVDGRILLSACKDIRKSDKCPNYRPSLYGRIMLWWKYRNVKLEAKDNG
jgi:hypothetical protein